MRVGTTDGGCDQEAEPLLTEEQEFYSAQALAFADLRAYHAQRPRYKRPVCVDVVSSSTNEVEPRST